MDRWKSRGAKSQTGAESEGRKVRREKIRRKKMQVCEKVGKSRNTVFFRCFVAPEGRKVGSLKRRVRRHLGRWEMKSCTPLWREADFEVKRYKTPGSRSTFGSWDVQKVHAVVARSTFRSQNVQNTPGPDHFWQLRCRKSARRCGAKHISKWNVQNTTCSRHFWRFRCRFAWQAQRIVHLVKSEQNVRFLWHFQKRWQAWDIWRGSAKMHFPWQAQYKRHGHERCSEVRALISWEGLHFGVSDLQVCWDDFAWQVQHFVWPGINFSWQAQYFTQVEWKNRKTHWYEAPSAALNFPFLKKVSQNCCVFDVVKFKHWGSLAELLRFWTLLGWKLKEVSQNCFVFDVVKFEKWGSLAEELRFQSGR